MPMIVQRRARGAALQYLTQVKQSDAGACVQLYPVPRVVEHDFIRTFLSLNARDIESEWPIFTNA